MLRLELTAWRTGFKLEGFAAVFANDIGSQIPLLPTDVLKAAAISGVNFGVSADEIPVD